MKKGLVSKVCILSMQRVENMGSLLQAYALKKTLENMGCEVEFLDIQPNAADDKLRNGRYLDFSAGQGLSGLRKLQRKLKKIDKYIINRIKVKFNSRTQKRYFDEFRQNVLHIDKTSAHYDICVIGSDEVFGCMSKVEWGFTTQLFGNVKEAERVITYAASCGPTRFQDLPEKVVFRIQEAFERISSFSVRDKNTFEFVKKLTGKRAQEHLDPVLIYDFSSEVEQADMPKIPKRYCIIYSYPNRFNDQKEAEAIKEFCDKHKLIPVTLGGRQYWANRYITCSPFQCLKLFEKADFIITDTFHGTIFSAKYAKKFAVLVRESNYNKLSDLIVRLGIEEHWMRDIGELEEKYAVSKNTEHIQEVIDAGKEASIAYLQKNIVTSESNAVHGNGVETI